MDLCVLPHFYLRMGLLMIVRRVQSSEFNIITLIKFDPFILNLGVGLQLNLGVGHGCK